MKYLIITALFTATLIFQTTVLNLISIFGVTPNLLLCLVVAISYRHDDYSALIFGPVFGLLIDICTLQYIGVSALAYLLLAATIIFTRHIFNRESIVVILMITAVATVCFNLFLWAVNWLLIPSYSIIYVLQMQPLMAIYNVAVMAVLYKALIVKTIRHRRDKYFV